MGQVLHRGATTTEAVRRAIQHSQESLRTLARRHGINPKTVAKWKKRCSVADLRTGPKHPRSTVLTVEQEAIIVAFRRHTLLPLDDCLYALQATIPLLTRSSLHRCLERHGISRLPEVEGSSKPGRKKFERYPIGYFHVDLAEVRTAEGKLYLFVAIDRTSKFAFVELVERADMQAAARFLSLDQRASRAHEPHHQRGHGSALPLRHPRPAAYPPQRLRRCLQLRKRLKTLHGLTAYEFICKCWQTEPDRFTLDPIHQMPGLNT
jgi:transposase-like protein